MKHDEAFFERRMNVMSWVGSAILKVVVMDGWRLHPHWMNRSPKRTLGWSAVISLGEWRIALILRDDGNMFPRRHNDRTASVGGGRTGCTAPSSQCGNVQGRSVRWRRPLC